jgi:C-terminal processing protease CtpA/Prc
VIAELENHRPGFIGITMGVAEVEAGDVVLPAVQVTGVEDGTPAAATGLRAGDSIVAIDGESWEPGDTSKQLARRVGAMKPGREIVLEVFRDGEKKEMMLKLAARPWQLGEVGDVPQMRVDPFTRRLLLVESEEDAKEKAFRGWLEENGSQGAEP